MPSRTWSFGIFVTLEAQTTFLRKYYFRHMQLHTKNECSNVRPQNIIFKQCLGSKHCEHLVANLCIRIFFYLQLIQPVVYVEWQWTTKSGFELSSWFITFKFFIKLITMERATSNLQKEQRWQFFKSLKGKKTLKTLWCPLTLFYTGGGVKKTPPRADYCTLILGGCPEWADFSWLCSFQY